MSDSYTTYGTQLDSEAITRVLEHIFRTNLANEEKSASATPNGQGKRPTPICIWGLHGIGKTAIVKAFAAANGWKFRYCAPAQFVVSSPCTSGLGSLRTGSPCKSPISSVLGVIILNLVVMEL